MTTPNGSAPSDPPGGLSPQDRDRLRQATTAAFELTEIDKIYSDVQIPTPFEGVDLRSEPQFVRDEIIHQRRETEALNEKMNKALGNWREVARQIGPRYLHVDFAGFVVPDNFRWIVDRALDFAETIPEHTAAGDGLLCLGPRGTGKDHLAIACLRLAAITHFLSVGWVDGQSLYSQARDMIGKTQLSERDFIFRFTNPAILLISDPLPQADGLTEFQQSTLWRIVDRRYRDLKPTWLTVNATSEAEMVQRLGGQIVDRIAHGATVISTVGLKSYRQPHSAAKSKGDRP